MPNNQILELGTATNVHAFSTQFLPPLTFTSLEASTGASISIYASRKHCEAQKNGSEVTFGPAKLDLLPLESDKATTEFQTPEGHVVQITYKSASPTLLSLQLADKKLRPAALNALAKLSPNRQLFLDYLALPSLVKILVTALRQSLKRSSADPSDDQPIAVIWNAISSDIRLIRRVAESCPDLVERFWTLIRKDKDKHASRYGPIFAIFKQLSGFAGGSDLLPQCVATFARSVQTLGPDSYELLIQIIPLLTYFDPKYSQYYVSHTNTVEMLAKAFQTAIDKTLGPVVFDQLFAFVRFLGKPHASALQAAGIFEQISSLTLSAEPRIQVNAIQVTSSFGLELRDDSIESLLKSITSHSSSFARVQSALQLEKVLVQSPPSSMRVPIASALVSAISLSIEGLVLRSLMMINSLQLTTEELIASGLLSHYQTLLARCLKSPLIDSVNELTATFEVLLDCVKRTGLVSTVIDLPPVSADSKSSKSLVRTHLSPVLLDKIAEIGLYETLSQECQDLWFTHHLAFWVAGHQGLASRSPEARPFFAFLGKFLGSVDATREFKMEPFLDVATFKVLQELRFCAQDFTESPSSDSERVLAHLSGVSAMAQNLLNTNIYANSLRLTYHNRTRIPVESTVLERLTDLLGERTSLDPLTANVEPHLRKFAKYSPSLESLLFEIINKKSLTDEVNHSILQIVRSDLFQKRLFVGEDLPFVNGLLVILNTTHEMESFASLIGDLIAVFPTLKAPLALSPLPLFWFWLLEGILFICTKYGSWYPHLKQMVSEDSFLRLVLFESAILTQLMEEEPESANWGTYREARHSLVGHVEAQVEEKEDRKTIFRRHAEYLGDLMEASTFDLNASLPSEIAEVCDTPFWLIPKFVSTMISSSLITGRGPTKLRASLLKYVDLIRHKLLPPGSSKRRPSKVETEDASSSLDALAKDATPFEKVLMDVLSDTKAVFISMLNTLKDIFMSIAPPSVSQFDSLREVCSMWNVPCTYSSGEKGLSPREYFETATDLFLPERLRFLAYLIFILDYLHAYDEFYVLQRKTDSTWNSDTFSRFECHVFVHRFISAHRTHVSRNIIPLRIHTFGDYFYADSEMMAIFGEEYSNSTADSAARSHDYGAKLPAFPREERLELVRLLMSIAIDVLNRTPKRHLLPLVPVRSINPESSNFHEINVRGNYRVIPHRLRHENLRNFAHITITLFKFAAELFGSLSLYPAPSISRPALEWLTTKFWPEFPDYTDCTNAKDTISATTHLETFIITNQLMDPALWIPNYFESWMALHFHDPLLMAKVLRGITNRWTIDASALRPADRSPTLYTHTNALLIRYVKHLQDLLNDPATWERNNILSVKPELIISKQRIRTKVPVLDVIAVNHFLLVSRLPFKLPVRPGSEPSSETSEAPQFTTEATKASTYNEDTSSFHSHYNDTLEWTDWDELEWFTRPVTSTSPDIRVYPLDFAATTVRLENFVSNEPWESYHPFVNIVEPKSIPKDETERLATIAERLPAYVAALGDAIVAATELLAIADDERRKKAPHGGVHPQLVRTVMRIDNLDFDPALCAFESVYVLASHIFCREKVEERVKAYSPLSPSAPNSGLASATGLPASGSTDMHRHYLINLQRDLDKKLLLMPELRDFAWKLLSVRHGSLGPSAALALHNAYTLQALMELELQDAESTRLKTLDANWLSNVAPALCYYGTLGLQLMSSKLKSKARKALLKTAGGLQKEALKDYASIIDCRTSIATIAYPEYCDFLIAYLRPEDHAVRPRFYDENYLDNATLSPSPQPVLAPLFAQRMWNHVSKLIRRAAARLSLLIPLAHNFPDFPWDDLLYAPIDVPRLTEEERADGCKRFAYPGPPQPEWAKEADCLMSGTRSTYHLPDWPIPAARVTYHVPGAATGFEEFVLKNTVAISDWRHAMEAPSFLRMMCSMTWLVAEEKANLEMRNWQLSTLWRLQYPIWTLLCQAVSRPLHAAKFITDPYYVSYLDFMTREEPSGPLEMRLASLLTRTGLFESPALVTPAGVSTTPKDDIIDEKRGTIVFGLGAKNALFKNNRYFTTLRTTLNKAFMVVYQPFTINFAPLVYATLMTHDYATWSLETRRLKAGPSIMWGIHLDLVHISSYEESIRETSSLFRYKEETASTLHVLRCQTVMSDRRRVPLPNAYPLLSGVDMSEAGIQATSSSASPSTSSSSNASATGVEISFAPFGSLMQSPQPPNWEHYVLSTVNTEMAALSQLPTLFATAKIADDIRSMSPIENPGLNGIALITPPPFIMMSHFKMLTEGDYNPQADFNWPCKKIAPLNVNAAWPIKLNTATLPRFTANTKPYFLSNGVTGAVLPSFSDPHMPQDLKVFPNADARVPGRFTSLLSFYALPYNRVVNVWYPQFALTLAPSTGESSISRFVFSHTEMNSMLFLRIGMATRSAIAVLNANPLFGAGDVPGSFAFSFHESGVFEQGIYTPIVGSKWLRLRATTAGSHFFMDLDTHMGILQYHGDLKTSEECFKLQSTTVLRDFDPNEEYLPVLSFYSLTNFRFNMV